MTAVLDSIGWIIKAMQESFLPIYQQHLDSLVGSLCKSELPHVQAAGICMLDDVLEHCGPKASPMIVPRLLACIDAGLSSDEPIVRQACSYGAGLCGSMEVFTSMCLPRHCCRNLVFCDTLASTVCASCC